MEKTPSSQEYAVFGEHAEFIAILFDRIETSADPFMGMEGILAFNFSETPEPQLDRLLELADERESAWDQNVAEKAVAHELSQRRGCIGQVLATFRVPLPEPKPFVAPPRPKYDVLRSIVGAARIQKSEEADLLEQLEALVRNREGDDTEGGASDDEPN
jgi:hypothetical protein